MSAKPLDELRRRLGNGPAPGAFAALAEEHRRSGRFEEAVTVCREGLARYPAYVSARVTLGRALLDMGDTSAAIDELEQAVSQAPDNLAATKALEAAREAAGERGGAPATGFAAPDTQAASPPDGAVDAAPAASSLDWLTADGGDVPWQLGSVPAPVNAEEGEVEAPEPVPVPESTAWDETIYAPVMPLPLQSAAADVDEPVGPSVEHHETPDAVLDPAPPADTSASASVVWLSDEVMAFPAFRAEEPVLPVGEGLDEPAVEPGAATPLVTTELDEAWPAPTDTPAPESQLDELLNGDDPMRSWAGFADAPAHSDARSWGETVDAAMGEVFDQVGSSGADDEHDRDAEAGLGADWTTPPADEAPAVAPHLAASGDTAAGPPVPVEEVPVEEAVPALRTLETLLLAIRERRAALAQGRPDVD